MRCGDLVVSIEAQRACIGDKPVTLTKKEFQMLELLALRLGSPVTKEMFLSHLYGGMDEAEMKIIDVFDLQASEETRLSVGWASVY